MSLKLNSNQLTGPMPPELGQLTNLRHLVLHSNQLTGLIPAELGELINLVTLDLSENRLTGRVPPGLGDRLKNLEFLNLGGNELTDYMTPGVFSSDPLGLISHADVYRQYSIGDEVWKVWLCDNPTGDVPIESNRVIALLNREIIPYFLWLSDDRYLPTFEYTGEVTGDSLSVCEQAAREKRSGGPILVIDDAAAAGGYASGGRTVVVGGTAVVRGPGWPEALLSIVAHEMGHDLGFPHSFGEKIRWSTGNVYEGDNPMDLMSGVIRVGPDHGDDCGESLCGRIGSILTRWLSMRWERPVSTNYVRLGPVVSGCWCCPVGNQVCSPRWGHGWLSVTTLRFPNRVWRFTVSTNAVAPVGGLQVKRVGGHPGVPSRIHRPRQAPDTARIYITVERPAWSSMSTLRVMCSR